jgi:hypothetical protein
MFDLSEESKKYRFWGIMGLQKSISIRNEFSTLFRTRPYLDTSVLHISKKLIYTNMVLIDGIADTSPISIISKKTILIEMIFVVTLKLINAGLFSLRVMKGASKNI